MSEKPSAEIIQINPEILRQIKDKIKPLYREEFYPEFDAAFDKLDLDQIMALKSFSDQITQDQATGTN